jgi:hypothetical protein
MTAYAATGTLLQVDDGGGVTFTTVANVGDIDGPAVSVDTEEYTNHSSPGGYEQLLPTIKRSGEVSFPVSWDPNDPTHDGTTGLVFLANARLTRNWRMVFPTSPARRWNFQGFITEFSTGAPVAGMLSADVTIKVTGQPTLS